MTKSSTQKPSNETDSSTKSESQPTTKTKPHIMIGLPTMGHVHTELAVVLMAWAAKATRGGKFGLSVQTTSGVAPVDKARNDIVEDFLKNPHATHLLFIDSDTIPNFDDLEKMIDHDEDVISGITPIIRHEFSRKNDSNGFFGRGNCVDMSDQVIQPNTGMHDAKSCGSSFILIKKSVFERIGKPFYRFIYETDDGKPTFFGEDYYFTARCLAEGIQPKVDSDILCYHYKPIIWGL